MRSGPTQPGPGASPPRPLIGEAPAELRPSPFVEDNEERSQPDQRRRFATRLGLAILAFTAALTFLPFGKPDQSISTADGNAALGSGPSTTTTRPTTTQRPPDPKDVEDRNMLFIDMAAVNAQVGIPPGIDPTSLEGWVEPTIEPEAEWVDGGNGVKLPDVLLRIRFCESTNNYQAANSSSSARGAYQFLSKSWGWYGHAENYGVAEAHLALPAQQDQAALDTYRQSGARPWAESRACWGNRDIDERYLTATPPTAAPAVPTTATPATTIAPPTAPSTTTNP